MMNENMQISHVVSPTSNRVIQLLTKVGDEHLIDSRIVARGIGIEHEVFLRTLRKYQNDVERWGFFRFQNGKIDGKGRPETYIMLNKNQALFAITLSRNTPEVVGWKVELIEAFDLIGLLQVKPLPSRKVQPCSNRHAITGEQEKELVFSYVHHVWFHRGFASSATYLSYYVTRLDRDVIAHRANELVAEGRLETFTTPHTRKYRPNQIDRKSFIGIQASRKR